MDESWELHTNKGIRGKCGLQVHTEIGKTKRDIRVILVTGAERSSRIYSALGISLGRAPSVWQTSLDGPEHRPLPMFQISLPRTDTEIDGLTELADFARLGPDNKKEAVGC